MITWLAKTARTGGTTIASAITHPDVRLTSSSILCPAIVCDMNRRLSLARPLLSLENSQPNYIPTLAPLDEANNFSRGVALEDLADAWIAAKKEYVRRLCVPGNRLSGITRTDKLLVDELKRISRRRILELVF